MLQLHTVAQDTAVAYTNILRRGEHYATTTYSGTGHCSCLD